MDERAVYEDVRLLGAGAFGQAILVRHTTTSFLAVKKIVDLKALGEEEVVKATREAEYLKNLSNLHIVAYKDSYVEGQHMVIVMEYADGGDLAMYIKRKKKSGQVIDEKKVLFFALQVTLGLLAIHDRYLIHRDLKPQNIFLTSGGCIKLGDLGVARALQHTDSMATTIIGTVYYLSPEICGEKPYDHKTDMWSLGCCIYEMCELTRAFDAKVVPAVFMKIMGGAYAPVSDRYSSGLKDCIAGLLTVDPAQRMATKKMLSLPVFDDIKKGYRAWKRSLPKPGEVASLDSEDAPQTSSIGGQSDNFSDASSMVSAVSARVTVVHKPSHEEAEETETELHDTEIHAGRAEAGSDSSHTTTRLDDYLRNLKKKKKATDAPSGDTDASDPRREQFLRTLENKHLSVPVEPTTARKPSHGSERLAAFLEKARARKAGSETPRGQDASSSAASATSDEKDPSKSDVAERRAAFLARQRK